MSDNSNISTPIKKEKIKSSSSNSDRKKDPTVQITKVLSKTSIQDQSSSSQKQQTDNQSSQSPLNKTPTKKEHSSKKPLSSSSSSSSTSTSIPTSIPKESIKFLNKNLKLQNIDQVNKSLSKSNTNFTVVGVIGGQSTGKSTLLTSLIKRSLSNQQHSQEQQEQPQNPTSSSNNSSTINTAIGSTTAAATTTTTTPNIPIPSTTFNLNLQQKINKINEDFINNLKIFESLTDNNFGLGKHQTIGIDLFVSEEERIIYLDTQPLQSLSIICEMIEENVQLPNQYTSYEHFHHMECLKLVVFLLSVCNIVLIVQENKALDIPLCKLIRTASLLLKNKTPDVSNPTPNGTLHNFENDILESTARQIFIFNKLTEIEMNDRSFDKTLSVLFSNPKNLYQSFISNLASFNNNLNNFNSTINNNGVSNHAILGNEKTNQILLESKCQSMTHFDSFFIPDKYMQEIMHNATTEILGVNSSDMLIPSGISNPSKNKRPQQTNTKLQPTFNESIETLHKHLLLLRSDSKFTHEITERQWFENSNNLWKYIQECDLMDSYNNQLLKSKYSPLNQFNQQLTQQHHHNHNQRDHHQHHHHNTHQHHQKKYNNQHNNQQK